MSYAYAEKLVQKHNETVLKNLAIPGISIEDGAYYLTGVMHSAIRMLDSLCKRSMSPEQAKVSLQIALETVLLDMGMSVRIHELESPNVQ